MVVTFYGKAGAKKHKDTNTSQVELELERIRELPVEWKGGRPNSDAGFALVVETVRSLRKTKGVGQTGKET
jgi:hypothetical protein